MTFLWVVWVKRFGCFVLIAFVYLEFYGFGCLLIRLVLGVGFCCLLVGWWTCLDIAGVGPYYVGFVCVILLFVG